MKLTIQSEASPAKTFFAVGVTDAPPLCRQLPSSLPEGGLSRHINPTTIRDSGGPMAAVRVKQANARPFRGCARSMVCLSAQMDKAGGDASNEEGAIGCRHWWARRRTDLIHLNEVVDLNDAPLAVKPAARAVRLSHLHGASLRRGKGIAEGRPWKREHAWGDRSSREAAPPPAKGFRRMTEDRREFHTHK